VVSIVLPALRDRPGDLAPLAQSFLQENPDAAAKGIRGISSAAMMMMQNYPWPGNVRELKNVVWRAVSLTESNQITPLDLPPDFLNTANPLPRLAGRFRQAKLQAIHQFEGEYLRQLLAEAGGNVSEAARQAGMRRPALHRLLQKHKLDAAQFRSRH
jgi:DNA-binding NtrC family response regulator